jgi:hypothetical protein
MYDLYGITVNNLIDVYVMVMLCYGLPKNCQREHWIGIHSMEKNYLSNKANRCNIFFLYVDLCNIAVLS